MRRSLLLTVPAAALLLQSCLPSSVTLPQSPALKWMERRTGRIAYVNMDGNVMVTDQAGGTPKAVTADASIGQDNSSPSFFYQFPAWAPDGKSLAFIGVHGSNGKADQTGVWTAKTDGTAPVRVYSSDSPGSSAPFLGAGFIATGVRDLGGRVRRGAGHGRRPGRRYAHTRPGIGVLMALGQDCGGHRGSRGGRCLGSAGGACHASWILSAWREIRTSR